METDDGPVAGRGAQRRRIGLLAILAVARRPVSRDKVVAYLWEEADTERARKLLSESLYVLRKALGEDAIVAAGDSIQLNESVVGTDVADFSTAIERGDDARAVEVYAGPFLDGFFISDALEFENWAAAERESFARMRAAALTRLAGAAEASHDHAGAQRWWRKLAEQDPYNAASALGLMRALDAAGDRAGALQHARVHAALLRSEFDADADPQVDAFARALQSSPPRAPALPAPVVADAPTPPALLDADVHSAPPVTPTKSRRLQRGLLAGAALTILLIVVAGWLWKRAASQVERPVNSSLVVVLPFTVHGPQQALRMGMVDLLSTNLDGAGEFRAVDPHSVLGSLRGDPEDISARRAQSIAHLFGATHFVRGDVTEAGDQLQVSATLYDVNGAREIVRASTRGPADSLLVLVDRLSAQLLASRGANTAELTQIAAYTTSSYPALKHYLEGERHYRAARYSEAVSSFSRAVAVDDAFALADYRLSAAAEWNFDFLLARRAAQRALRSSARLSDHHRSLLRAWNHFLSGDAASAEREYQSVLTSHPEDVEARAGLGEVLAHYNPVRGQPAEAASDAFERVLALAPAYGEVRFHALEFAVRNNRKERFDSLLAGVDGDSPQHPAWRAVRAFTWGTPAEVAAALDDLKKSDEIVIGIAAGRLGGHAHDFAGAERIARELVAPGRTEQWRAGGHLLLSELALARGDWRQAHAELDLARKFERDWPVELAALYALHPLAPANRSHLMERRNELLAWDPRAHTPSSSFFLAAHYTVHDEIRLYLLGLVSARLGEPAQATRYQRELERSSASLESRNFARALARSVAGHIALAQGDRAKALELLSSATIDAPPELLALSPIYSRAHDRFTIAEINSELGKKQEATRWYRSLLDGYDFMYVAAAQQRLRNL